MKCPVLVSLAVLIAVRAEAKPFFKGGLRSPAETNVADLREGAPDEENQAVPGILQKKLAKILRKIQFIASLANGFTTRRPEPDADFEGFGEDSATTERAPSPTEPVAEAEQLEATSSRLQNVKYEPSPVGVGIYFMELVGSLVGLVYGAALHAANATQPKV